MSFIVDLAGYSHLARLVLHFVQLGSTLSQTTLLVAQLRQARARLNGPRLLD